MRLVLLALRLLFRAALGKLPWRSPAAGHRRARRALQRRGLYFVVDVALGKIVPEGFGTFSSLPYATRIATDLEKVTGRVYALAMVVDARPLEAFEASQFGPADGSPGGSL